jgi:hypothetical protein
MVWACIFLALAFTVPVASHIQDIVVIEGERTACDEGYYKVQHDDSLNGDLNEGAKGHYIWLCVSEGQQAGVDPISEVAVTASDSESGRNLLCPGGWSLVRQGYDSNGDLNHGAGGEYIYLCIKREPKKKLAALKLNNGDCDAGYFRTPTGGESNGDLNQGAGGKYIYLCVRRACTAEKSPGHWERRGGQIAGATTETWTVGTSQTSSETKTEDWKQSVTETVSAGFSFENVGGASVEISGTIAHETSTALSSAWTEDDSNTYEVKYRAEDIGKQPWQFIFAPSDSCGNTVRSAAQSLAITDGAWEEPCCLPSYADDAPYSRICHSQDAMIAGGLDKGCKVATQLNISFVV